MVNIERTSSKNKKFQKLVKKLDAYLKIVDGDEHDFYNQYNGIESLSHVVIATIEDQPVGCGAFKKYDSHSVEIKRMYTLPEMRNKKIASILLNELELWAKELGYKNSILETGKRQVEAVSFYSKNKYKVTPNFGPYKNIENSVCFKKNLKSLANEKR
jgi:GNAT superfamily N-acetyltransferase